ncbi:hypothetical protein PSH03_006103 [Micromonospora sp. PSH03]|uniref:hypothetical protein n=1 Tax=Micromonospora salmantinae TaxID=2911211 RepID=UPI001EE94005|nr:hypothetical protein [Micromonospora salmantinae]MCG5455037.1 hypothetical protein [Micromonospora salmantinae]
MADLLDVSDKIASVVSAVAGIASAVITVRVLRNGGPRNPRPNDSSASTKAEAASSPAADMALHVAIQGTQETSAASEPPTIPEPAMTTADARPMEGQPVSGSPATSDPAATDAGPEVIATLAARESPATIESSAPTPSFENSGDAAVADGVPTEGCSGFFGAAREWVVPATWFIVAPLLLTMAHLTWIGRSANAKIQEAGRFDADVQAFWEWTTSHPVSMLAVALSPVLVIAVGCLASAASSYFTARPAPATRPAGQPSPPRTSREEWKEGLGLLLISVFAMAIAIPVLAIAMIVVLDVGVLVF